MKRFFFFTGMLFAFFLSTAAQIAFAQVDTARLQGTITDASGAALVGATVAVTNIDTGRETNVTANDLGYYTVSALPPGHYRVEVTEKGFKKVSRALELQVAQVAVADFRLDIAEVTQTITVDPGSPFLNPQNSAIVEAFEAPPIPKSPLTAPDSP